MSNLRQIPLTCSGHTRPVVHLDFNRDITECGYFLISACKGKQTQLCFHFSSLRPRVCWHFWRTACDAIDQSSRRTKSFNCELFLLMCSKSACMWFTVKLSPWPETSNHSLCLFAIQMSSLWKREQYLSSSQFTLHRKQTAFESTEMC